MYKINHLPPHKHLHQYEDKAQNDEGEDQEVEPPQEESNDQGGDAHDQDEEDEQVPQQAR